uniref:Ionotropic receptor 75q1 n=1 Tax=Streltzoviella insularis TaxID=1206366 RepID=A0A7D5YNX9_9NEOP|nr:ionotropic receptor 75q1 [Streltzoviella insularis]
MPLYYFMNATTVLTFPDAWGYYINGTWNGMIGDVVSGKADLAGSVMFITRQRIDFLDYLIHPSPGLTVKFLFREPPLSYQYNLFLLPFKLNVWLFTLRETLNYKDHHLHIRTINLYLYRDL